MRTTPFGRNSKDKLAICRAFSLAYTGSEKGRQFQNQFAYGPNGVVLILSLL